MNRFLTRVIRAKRVRRPLRGDVVFALEGVVPRRRRRGVLVPRRRRRRWTQRAVHDRVLNVFSRLVRKLFVIHVPTQSKRLHHVLRRAEDAPRPSRLVLLDGRPEFDVSAVRHERRHGEDVWTRLGFPHRRSVVHDDGEFSGEVRAARRRQRFQLVRRDGFHPVFELRGIEYGAVLIQYSAHLSSVLDIRHRAHEHLGAFRLPILPGQILAQLFPSRSHVHQHRRAGIGGIDNRKHHHPSFYVRTRQTNHIFKSLRPVRKRFNLWNRHRSSIIQRHRALDAILRQHGAIRL